MSGDRGGSAGTAGAGYRVPREPAHRWQPSRADWGAAPACRCCGQRHGHPNHRAAS